MAAIAAAAVIVFFLFFRKNTDSSTGRPSGQMPGQTQDSRITASGTTTVGMTTEELDLDNLDTKLYVEAVYPSDGDSVTKGDNVLKISDSTFESAKKELERAQEQADLAYREAVVTTAEDNIDAKSTYDQAAVNQKYAQQTYDAAVKEVTDKISDIQDQIDDDQDLIDEYTKAVNENYYYKYYDVENKQKEMNDTFALQMKLYDEWGIEALTNTDKTSSTSKSGQSGQDGQANVPTTICGKAGYLQGYITGYAAGENGGQGDAATSFSNWWSTNYGLITDPDSSDTSTVAAYEGILNELGVQYTDGSAGWWSGNAGAAKTAAQTSYSNSYNDGIKSGKQAAATNQKAGLSSTQAAATVDTSTTQEYVKVYELLTTEVENETKSYKEALKNYKEKTALAPTNLSKTQADQKKLNAQLAQLNTTLETTKASAKAAYDQTLAECSIAKETYDTAVKKTEEELTSLSNKKDDADDDMDYFNEILSDGYVHASKSGTIMKIMTEEGSYISGDEMVMAYTDDDSLAVAVSVDQADISSISLGESAEITIDDHGDYTGTVTEINPVSSSSSKSSVTYTVTVVIDGDISGLSQNLTASVTFGDADSGTVSGNSQTAGESTAAVESSKAGGDTKKDDQQKDKTE